MAGRTRAPTGALIAAAAVGVAVVGYGIYRVVKPSLDQLERAQRALRELQAVQDTAKRAADAANVPKHAAEASKAVSSSAGSKLQGAAQDEADAMRGAIGAGERTSAYHHYVNALALYMTAEQRYLEASKRLEADRVSSEIHELTRDFDTKYPELTDKAKSEAKRKQNAMGAGPAIMTVIVPAQRRKGSRRVSGLGRPMTRNLRVEKPRTFIYRSEDGGPTQIQFLGGRP